MTDVGHGGNNSYLLCSSGGKDVGSCCNENGGWNVIRLFVGVEVGKTKAKRTLMAMKRVFLLLVSVLVLLGLFACEEEGTPVDPFEGRPVDTAQVCFVQQVLPIFLTKCAFSGCHDSRTKADGYDLSSYDAIMRKGIRPGDPKHSKIYTSLIATGEDRMPPAPYPPLPEDEILVIRNWILQGAQNTDCSGGVCDTLNMSYASDIEPILRSYCIGCHSGTSPSGGILLDNYQSVKTIALSGRLYGAVAHLPGYKAMPPGGSSLDSCAIAKIGAWVRQGCPPVAAKEEGAH